MSESSGRNGRAPPGMLLGRPDDPAGEVLGRIEYRKRFRPWKIWPTLARRSGGTEASAVRLRLHLEVGVYGPTVRVSQFAHKFPEHVGRRGLGKARPCQPGRTWWGKAPHASGGASLTLPLVGRAPPYKNLNTGRRRWPRHAEQHCVQRIFLPHEPLSTSYTHLEDRLFS